MSDGHATIAAATGVDVNARPEFIGITPSNSLEPYVNDPTGPESKDRTWYHDNDWNLIFDKFPKAQLHFLLISRHPRLGRVHPAIALCDPDFLADTRKAVAHAKGLIAGECRRRWDEYNTKKRNWEDELQAGIHMSPSCSNLHIHIFTPDRIGDRLTKRIYYKTFSTPFMVSLDEFPLPSVTPQMIEDMATLAANGKNARLPPDAVSLGLCRNYYLAEDTDMVCWRCNKAFDKDSFEELRSHLGEEFELWKSGSPLAVTATSDEQA